MTHISLHARRRRLAVALTLGLLVTGPGITTIADETSSPSASSTVITTAETSPETGAAQRSGQSPADQAQTSQSPTEQGQADQSNRQAIGRAAVWDATDFKADNPGWVNATRHTGAVHGIEKNYTTKRIRTGAMQIQRVSNPNAPSGTNSMPEQFMMPEVFNGFPTTSDDVWV